MTNSEISEGWTREEYIKGVMRYLGLKSYEFYKTGFIKDLFRGSPSDVNDWFDEGKINGTKIPGSRHRRVTGYNLALFIADNDFMDYIETEKTYTPKEVGSFCGCGDIKIRKLMKAGQIVFGYKPFSRHKYVTRETLVKFLDDNDISYKVSKL